MLRAWAWLNLPSYRYVLMEQVQGAAVNEEGAYLRCSHAGLVGRGYQCRTGLIYAGDQGCAQVRRVPGLS
jgi:hypothetical protein